MNNENEALVAMDAGLSPIMDLSVAKQRLREFQEFVKEYLVKDEDYGLIPGTPKPTLYKPGSDKLCELYGLADDYVILDKVEDFDKGLFDYNVKCILTSKLGKFLVATGLGSCNSYEGRYRWREGKRKCPNCGSEAIIKGKAEYGGGWICFAKKGGCGAKYLDKDPKIVGQEVGKVQNDDIATLKNTILKMAKKRAKVDATLSATRSSGVFTQDIEDMNLGGQEPEDFSPKPKQAPQAAAPRPRTPSTTQPSPTPQIAPNSEPGGFHVPPDMAEQMRDEDYPEFTDDIMPTAVAEQSNHTVASGAVKPGVVLPPKDNSPKSKGKPEKISAKGRQLFWADCKKTGADEEMIRAAILEITGQESTKEVCVHQTGQIIERLWEMVREAKGVPSPFDEPTIP